MVIVGVGTGGRHDRDQRDAGQAVGAAAPGR
jgi:hypothetical protein